MRLPSTQKCQLHQNRASNNCHPRQGGNPNRRHAQGHHNAFRQRSTHRLTPLRKCQRVTRFADTFAQLPDQFGVANFMSPHLIDFVEKSSFCASFLGFGVFYFSSQSEMPLYAPPGAACKLDSDEPLNRAFGLKRSFTWDTCFCWLVTNPSTGRSG